MSHISKSCTMSKMALIIGLFKMFSRWIWGIFNIQIQSDRGHKLMLFTFQNKDKDLLGIYQYGCDLFCVSLLTDRHLKVRSNSILYIRFRTKSCLRLRVTRSITRCTQKSWLMTLYVTSPNFNVQFVIINFLLAKNHRENILQRTIPVHK